MKRNDMEAWLKILAMVGAISGAVLAIICTALSIVLGVAALMYWAAIFVVLSVLLVAAVAVSS